jgi:starch synthase
MPSLFEPSGVVQQEYFSGGTPVIAFKTGGLKDTIFEFDPIVRRKFSSWHLVTFLANPASGNGFTFEAHNHSDFVAAVKRSLTVFNNKENYAKLRQSSRESVLDVETVAIVWIKEFTRYCLLFKIY